MHKEGWRRALWLGLLFLTILSPFADSQLAEGVAGSQEDGERTFCSNFNVGTRRPGGTFQIFPTASPDDCCLQCLRLKACKFWTRQRSSGLCALKSDTALLVDGGNEYDSGAKEQTVVLGGSAEDSVIPLEFECSTEDGARRLGRPLPGRPIVDDPGECCRKCDEAVRCFSWSYQKATGICNLYSGLTITRRNPRFISGDIFWETAA